MTFSFNFAGHRALRLASGACTVLAATLALPALAANPGPFNTGVDDSGTPLAGGAVDPHYTIVSPAQFSAVYAFRDADGAPLYGPPLGPNAWLPDGLAGESSWVTPSAAIAIVDVPGVTDAITYRTSFDLSAFSAPGWQISGRWSADDGGVAIRINGLSVPVLTQPDYTGWQHFDITSGIVAGVNVLEFDTFSTQSPTGLRVEMSTSAVPEPGAWALLAGGLLLLGAGRRGALRLSQGGR